MAQHMADLTKAEELLRNLQVSVSLLQNARNLFAWKFATQTNAGVLFCFTNRKTWRKPRMIRRKKESWRREVLMEKVQKNWSSFEKRTR
jgi:hypothetical protein